MSIRAVLFDFAHTLVDCDSWFQLELHTLVRETLADLERQGLVHLSDGTLERADVVFRQIRQQARETEREAEAVDSLRQVFHTIGMPSVPNAALEDTVARLQRSRLDSVELLPGATEAVTGLFQAGLQLGVVSNAAYSAFVTWSLERVGLAPMFNTIITSADVGWRKPRPEIYRVALEHLAVLPTEAVYVGDYHPFDIVGARAAGLKSIWAPSTRSPIEGLTADAIVSDLGQVPAIIREWSPEQSALDL